MTNFSFPILDKNDICSHFAQLGAPKLSVENLLSPSPEALLPVYDFLASCGLFPESREESMQLEFPSVQMLGDHPEWYLESHGVLKSFDRLSKYMQNAGVQDFAVINDLYRPESLRTIRFLSAAINFIMFCAQKHTLIAELKSTRDEELAKLEDLHSEESKMETEIAQIERERAAKYPQVEALEREIKEVNTQLQGLNKQQLGLQLEINNLKQEDVNKLDKISNLDFEIMQKQQQGAHLRSQILENPQELQKMLQEKETALAEEEALRKNALEIWDIWKAKVGVIEKADKKASKLQTLALTVEDQVKNRDIDKVLKERKARRKAIEKESWACDAIKNELIWGVRRLEELSEKLSQDCTPVSKELEAVKTKQEKCRIKRDAARYLAVKELDMQTEAGCKNSADIVMEKKMQIAKQQDVSDRLFGAALMYAETKTPSAEMRLDMDIKGCHRGSDEIKLTPQVFKGGNIQKQ